jgi:murein DD-endopeptidase MepM/ murein hydrolase activator NlpD
MRHYTLILVGDEQSPVRRFQISERLIKNVLIGLGAFVLVLGVGTWDYQRTLRDNAELDGMRVKTAEQTQEIEKVRSALGRLNNEIEQVRDLERKVRIIANLPGTAAIGGAEVTDLVPEEAPSTRENETLLIPAGVPIGVRRDENLEPRHSGTTGPGNMPPTPDYGLESRKARAMRQLTDYAGDLADNAILQSGSLGDLMLQLEDKSNQLVSMPSIWPTRGWLTSRYGPRVSPFTGARQKHAGIDIAAESGTPVVAPARGKIIFAARKGPLGNALVVEHGYGVRTLYGHVSKFHVEKGQQVERGQLLAAVGSTGRSTGPHLHYVVEVDGKSRNPLDYIFD